MLISTLHTSSACSCLIYSDTSSTVPSRPFVNTPNSSLNKHKGPLLKTETLNENFQNEVTHLWKVIMNGMSI